MKKGFAFICAAILVVVSVACAAPATNDIQEETAISATAALDEDDISRAATVDELSALMQTYQAAGDFERVYQCGVKMTELEPDNPEGYLAASSALLAINEQNEQEMKRLLTQILTNAPESAEIVDGWMKSNGIDGAVELPFVSDYSTGSAINMIGNSTGNMTNALRDGYWRGGFVTTQAGWIYFSRFTEDCNAIYKMRTDGSSLQRVGEAHGYSLNVVGDWIYFIDPTANSTPYRMRTDGEKIEKLADFSCAFLSVAGDWVYTDGYGESGALCKFRTDGSEKTALTDFVVIDCCAYGDWVYFFKKSMEDGGLLRTRPDGTGTQVVVSGIPLSFAISDDVIYYVHPNDPYCIMQCELDGANAKQVFRAMDTITAVNVNGDTLIVAYGVSFDKDGFTLSNTIVMVDIPTGEILKEWEAHTEPLCVGEGFLFYTEDEEGMRWHCMNLETGEQIPME